MVILKTNGPFWQVFHNSCNLSITLTDRNLRIIYHIDLVVDLSKYVCFSAPFHSSSWLLGSSFF